MSVWSFEGRIPTSLSGKFSWSVSQKTSLFLSLSLSVSPSVSVCLCLFVFLSVCLSVSPLFLFLIYILGCIFLFCPCSFLRLYLCHSLLVILSHCTHPCVQMGLVLWMARDRSLKDRIGCSGIWREMDLHPM